MCIPKKHIEKYKSNLAFIEHLDSSRFSDWYVTGAFYAGLHRLDAYLHLKYDAKDDEISTHTKVKTYMGKKELLKTKALYTQFQLLSHMARYTFEDMTPRVNAANQYLHALENQCTL